MRFLRKLIELDDKVVGINRRNSELVYRNNPLKYFPLANDKIICKELLQKSAIPTPITYGVIDKMGDMKTQLAPMHGVDAVCIKPAMGSRGGGIMILKKNDADTWLKPMGAVVSKEEIQIHVANILFGMYSFGSSDRAIIEYCLNPHPFFSKIYPNGVPDFRVIIHDGKPLMAMLRMPNNKSDGKANLHMGALGIGINMANGVIKSGFDGKNYVDKHPDTGVQFAGMKIPEWEKTMEISLATARLFPLKYIGVDVVFDIDFGPMVIEVNARPGIEIQNINKTGLMEVLNQLPVSSRQSPTSGWKIRKNN